MTLPHSDACFVAAYPAAATEAWLDGHNAFVFFGGVPQRFFTDIAGVHQMARSGVVEAANKTMWRGWSAGRHSA